MKNNEEIKNSIKDRIYEIKGYLAQKRATGRTSRLVNEIIEDFFIKPCCEQILIEDHYMGFNTGIVDGKNYTDNSHHHNYSDEFEAHKMACAMLAEKVKLRLDTEYKGIKYKITSNYPYTLTRLQKTRAEEYNEELEKLTNTLNNL